MEIPPEKKYIALKTFKKNGDGVVTPVWYVKEENSLWVTTRKKTAKVKRIRNNNKVQIAISDFSGNPKGQWFYGIAKIVEGDVAKRAIRLRNKKYGFMSKVVSLFSSSKGDYVVYHIEDEFQDK
ncbi:MAG: PPOX class F420-dependent oxidoreductase [Nitrosopumilaceae archaeon]|nr:PPOX class F420-dependent oxidoreductase [Nitrosopumilaceae archaeon]NIP09960.1 PPOX class F420-dependent oxidoreductase [Nitrosopumilaceae archaeon]NIS94731.1 PPOX class F420-dependent oxidoreductase [Nitrosopumilaceae archaeon]